MTSADATVALPTDEALVRFLAELGMLRRIRHEGWRLVGVEQPPSVAEHTLRACHIGYFLAVLEQYQNPAEVVTLVAFHDITECRTGDHHKVAARYVKTDEEAVLAEQTQPLGAVGEAIRTHWEHANERSTPAGNIAKDADILEQALTAREFEQLGYMHARDWYVNAGKRLQTVSAQRLHMTLGTLQTIDWWRGLKVLPKN